MKKLEKIERDAQKAREKIAAMQGILKQIEGQRTEQENLQIVQQVRALKLSRDELYVFLSGGDLPASLAAAIGNDGNEADAPEPETIYSRRGRKRNAGPEHAPDAETTDTEMTDIEMTDTGIKTPTESNISESTYYESEDIDNENEG